MTVFLLLVVLFIGGFWGALMNIYEEIEDLIIKPIFRYLADQGLKLLPVFIIVAVAAMTLRKLVILAPLWYGLYFILTTVNNMPQDQVYQYIRFFAIAAGIIKAAECLREYYPKSKHWHGNY